MRMKFCKMPCYLVVAAAIGLSAFFLQSFFAEKKCYQTFADRRAKSSGESSDHAVAMSWLEDVSAGYILIESSNGYQEIIAKGGRDAMIEKFRPETTWIHFELGARYVFVFSYFESDGEQIPNVVRVVSEVAVFDDGIAEISESPERKVSIHELLWR